MARKLNFGVMVFVSKYIFLQMDKMKNEIEAQGVEKLMIFLAFSLERILTDNFKVPEMMLLRA